MSRVSVHEICKKTDRFSLVWAVQYVMSKGTRECATITDDEIEACYEAEIKRQETEHIDGICLYAPICVKWMLEAARAFGKIGEESFTELLNGLANEDLFENKAHPITWDRLSEIATVTLHAIDNEDVIDELDLTDDEKEYFELDTDEDEE